MASARSGADGAGTPRRRNEPPTPAYVARPDPPYRVRPGAAVHTGGKPGDDPGARPRTVRGRGPRVGSAPRAAAPRPAAAPRGAPVLRSSGGVARSVARSVRGNGAPAPVAASPRTGRPASGGGGSPAPARGSGGGSSPSPASPGKAAERSGKRYGKAVTRILKRKITGEKPNADAVNRALARFRKSHAWARDAGNADAARRVAMRLVNHRLYGAKPGEASVGMGGPDPVPGSRRRRRGGATTTDNFNRF